MVKENQIKSKHLLHTKCFISLFYLNASNTVGIFVVEQQQQPAICQLKTQANTRHLRHQQQNLQQQFICDKLCPSVQAKQNETAIPYSYGRRHFAQHTFNNILHKQTNSYIFLKHMQMHS
jgi:hypothetical protein